ncbi:cytochrome P450 [Paenibacillus sp. sptzw28]|uniref:cytochrome P450 n=1 Tax=Paenibacillus sp. sptzw28 TaxID=715179 RepID=UPI002161402A|nr:cytochrome P450 [Paenibacillus sp. sptzw28]
MKKAFPLMFISPLDRASGSIGNNFAMMEAVQLLAGIMQKFHFELDERHAVILEPSITLRPKKGIHMRLVKR